MRTTTKLKLNSILTLAVSRSTSKCTTKPVGKILDKAAIVFEAKGFKAIFFSPFVFVNTSSKSDLSTLKIHSVPLSPPSGLVSEHEQIFKQILRMRYRASVIYGHEAIAATRVLRFADHVAKINGGSGDENKKKYKQASLPLLEWEGYLDK